MKITSPFSILSILLFLPACRTPKCIIVNIQGHSICARGEILVREWGKLKDIRDANGGGYRGAVLQGLQIEAVQDSAQTLFVYKVIDRIID